MRAFVREVCQESWQVEPGDENLILRLTLALTEAASNIILHGSHGQQHTSITLTVEVDDDQAQRDANAHWQAVRSGIGGGASF